MLEKKIIPQLFDGKDAEGSVRVWVPGCATGEEAYSLAILLREHMNTLRVCPKVQLFATDIDDSAIGTARLGRYPSTLLEGLSAERRARFFELSQRTYVVSKEIRDLCTFSTHNVVRDPPFSRMDVVSCRNLLIYMNPELQARIIPIFHYSLVPGGILILGGSESVAHHADLFEIVDKPARIFRRRDVRSPDLPLSFQEPNLRLKDVRARRAAPTVSKQERNDVTKTHGKITRIADAMIDPQSARLFLADAVYFKGTWSHPFESKDTKERPFHLRSGTQKQVPMMAQTRSLGYLEEPDYQAVRLPYAGENLAMYVLLPVRDSSLADLVGKLSGDAWERIRRQFRNADGSVVIPKFKIEYGIELKRPLESSGMKLAFDPGRADFSGIAPRLFIAGAVQKTYVEVNEEGTEAAAVTGVAVATTAYRLPSPPFEMVVDRPFLFLIEDRPTQTILFVGLVFDPSGG